jgi:hypothetical protein
LGLGLEIQFSYDNNLFSTGKIILVVSVRTRSQRVICKSVALVRLEQLLEQAEAPLSGKSGY